MMAKGHRRRRRNASLTDPSTVATLLRQERNKLYGCSFLAAAPAPRLSVSSRRTEAFQTWVEITGVARMA